MKKLKDIDTLAELAEELSETSQTLAISGDGMSVEYAREFLDRAIEIQGEASHDDE